MPLQMACGFSTFPTGLRLLAVYLPILHLSSLAGRRIFDSLYDFVIAGTPTKIAGDGLLNFILCRMRVLFKKFRGRHNETGRAISTLYRTIFDKCLPDSMQMFAMG